MKLKCYFYEVCIGLTIGFYTNDSCSKEDNQSNTLQVATVFRAVLIT